MNEVEIYKREMMKIFQQITEIFKAANSDQHLKESERYAIKVILHETLSKTAAGVLHLMELSKSKENEP